MSHYICQNPMLGHSTFGVRIQKSAPPHSSSIPDPDLCEPCSPLWHKTPAAVVRNPKGNPHPPFCFAESQPPHEKLCTFRRLVSIPTRTMTTVPSLGNMRSCPHKTDQEDSDNFELSSYYVIVSVPSNTGRNFKMRTLYL